MLIRKLVVVGLVGFVTLAANVATAEDAVDRHSNHAIEGVDLVDPEQPIGARVQISAETTDARFGGLAPAQPSYNEDHAPQRGYEVRFVTPGVSGLNASFAQRAGLAFNDDGDIERQTRASEFRLGRNLNSGRNVRASREPRWYFFAASEDEALTWGPGAHRNEFGGAGSSFGLQDRVKIGDRQAGVTYEQYGIQASLAYVDRRFTVVSGSQSFTQDDSFAGLTVTMRH